jgi:NusA-like KH domain protein
MVKVLDMQFIRYANLFERVTRIRTNHCFSYNNTVIFAVPRNFVMQAIGRDNINLKKLSGIIGKRIKIVAIPHGIEDIENFVSIITYPIKFKAIDVKETDVIINADAQSKASLIGRGKIRLEEMQNILEQYFGIKKVIVR